MLHCCVCLGDYASPVIINTGETLCYSCMRDTCPTTCNIITNRLFNNFSVKFFRSPQLSPLPLLTAPPFDMGKMLISADRIAYMNQYDKIELNDRHSMVMNCEFLLSVDEFKVFASKCININYTNPHTGNQLIHDACTGNRLDVVKYLVEHGADVNCVNKRRERPINYACGKNGDKALELVKYLVENGADIYVDGLICDACWKGDEALELVKYLVGLGIDIHYTNSYGYGAIHSACQGGSLELVKFLVKRGVELNCSTTDGEHPIHNACNGNDTLELVKYLVKNGADINCTNEDGEQPIHMACFGGDNALELVKYLVENGADVNAISRYKMYPIHCACLRGGNSAINLVKYLIEMGADVNSGYGDETPIMLAKDSEGDATQLVKFLLENGAIE